MTGIPEVVHIIPLGIEFDRAVKPFERRKADRVYLLSKLNDSKNEEMVKEQRKFINKVTSFLESKDIVVRYVEVDLFDILDLLKALSKIIVEEKKNDSQIHMNMSAAGRLTSVAATLAGMYHEVNLYYVQANRYPRSDIERQEHGLSICDTLNTNKIENFQLNLPNRIEMYILVQLCKADKDLKTTDILNILRKSEFADFFEIQSEIEKKQKMKRNHQSRELMKLDKTFLSKLEVQKYITREKRGSHRYVSITDSGIYAAHISGLL